MALQGQKWRSRTNKEHHASIVAANKEMKYAAGTIPRKNSRADIGIVKTSFGKKTGQPGSDPRADVNHDGIVNIVDLATVARQLPAGTTCP